MDTKFVIRWMVVSLMVLLSGIDGRAQTVAERLGYPADARLLILHGDDIGMCHSANTSAIDALQKGIVTCGSIMVPCPWFLEIASYAGQHPEADLGLHLTLTSEWKFYRWRPLAAQSLVKGLIDSEGFMHHAVSEVNQNASPQEVEAELRAQITVALQHGIKPTHLDSHMGTIYYNPGYLPVAMKLSEEYDIPLMLFRASPEILKELGEKQQEQYTVLSQQLEQRGIPLIDALPSLKETPVDQYEEGYKELIAGLKPGVSEIILHLADESREYEAITGSYPRRLAEYRLFTRPAMKEYIEKQGIHLIGWKDLLPLWKQRSR